MNYTNSNGCHRHWSVMSKVSTPARTDSEKPQDDLSLFRVLKPYIGHCLTLNHELNNHLAGIIGYAEFLQLDNENLTEDQKKFVNHILSCAMRMHELIQNLCEDKISLSDKINLKSVMEAYENSAKPLD